MTPLWWPQYPKPGNFGDILSPHLLKEMGHSIVPVGREACGKVMAIGSTVKFAQPGDVVWGSGLMWKTEKPTKEAKYLLVRGPITGGATGCRHYGDPALLAPVFWPRTVPQTEHTGAIPHYVDYHKHDSWYTPQINILSDHPLCVLREMWKYHYILSSSLHGIILAHAYGIPAGWWRPSDSLDGDDVKFLDYAESVGITLTPAQHFGGVEYVLPDPGKIAEVQHTILRAGAKIQDALHSG